VQQILDHEDPVDDVDRPVARATARPGEIALNATTTRAKRPRRLRSRHRLNDTKTAGSIDGLGRFYFQYVCYRETR
ncbi:MAG TPA: hypothetical protein VIW95_00925, partial [Candidatus Binatus sp.]|uniref:hypothetical protein n=1 Tax=Candidatus Binatus sp. TaxID=2811406 RepID=UPI002F405F53